MLLLHASCSEMFDRTLPGADSGKQGLLAWDCAVQARLNCFQAWAGLKMSTMSRSSGVMSELKYYAGTSTARSGTGEYLKEQGSVSPSPCTS